MPHLLRVDLAVRVLTRQGRAAVVRSLCTLGQLTLGLLATALLTAWGLYAVANTPLDAIPDLSDTQVIVVESKRAEGWGSRLGRGTYGVLATVIDVTRDVDRSTESFLPPSDPFPSFATPLVPAGTVRSDAHRREYLLRMGESVVYSGVRIDFVASGDNDTVQISRTG